MGICNANQILKIQSKQIHWSWQLVFEVQKCQVIFG